MNPKKISVVEKSYLNIIWDNEEEGKVKLSNLRKFCPCAVCLAEKEERGRKYIPLYTLDQLTLTGIKQVGTYALHFTWKDGHDTGIYEYAYLRELSAAEKG